MLNVETFLKSVFALVHVTDPRESTQMQAYIASTQSQNVLILIVVEYILQCSLQYLPGTRIRVPRYMLNDAFAGLMAAMLELLFLPTLVSMTFPDAHSFSWKYRLFTLPGDSWLTCVYALIVYEFCYYCMHRAMHEVRFMWLIHQAHHDAQDLHIAMCSRHHIFTHAWIWFYYIPMALLGIPTQYLSLHSALNNAWELGLHTKFVPKHHWIIEYFFNTASHHRVHHGRNPYCIDTNYGGFLIIFDRIFGTFQEEDENEPVLYGVTKPLKTANPFVTQVYPFVDLFNDMRKCPWYMTPAVLFGGPGWSREEPLNRLGNKSDIPKVPNLIEDPDALERERFQPELNAFVQAYLLINLVLHLIVFLDMRELTRLQQPQLGLFLFYLLGSGSLGLLWDNISVGHWTELMRNSVAIGLLVHFGADSMLANLLILWSIFSLLFNLACGLDLAGRLGLEKAFAFASARYSSIETKAVELELGDAESGVTK